MFDIIWKEQIQKPKSRATIWQPKEKMKPDKPDRDCCEEAKNKWKEYIIGGRRDIPYKNPEGISYDRMEERGDIMGIANNTCKEFRSSIKVMGEGWATGPASKLSTKILEEWDECEGK